MKSIKIMFTVAAAFMMQAGIAQVTSIPQTAKDNFAKQYPAAENVEWDNDIVNVNVRFTLAGEKMNAEYSNKGIWKNTFQHTSFGSLPAEVQDGFNKSKFSDREVTDTKILYLPADVKQYRIKVEKNDLQKKYLYFDTSGKMIRDANTL